MARAKTYADRVNIVKMIKVDDRWTFASAVERNGRMVRDHVLVGGRDEHHPEGRYYLDWYEHGRKRRQAAPPFEELVAAARAKFIELRARKAGILVDLRSPEPGIPPAPLPTARHLPLSIRIVCPWQPPSTSIWSSVRSSAASGHFGPIGPL